MHRRTRGLFWLELVVAVTGFVMAIVTLIYPPWIELIFGLDPDSGSGALEAAIAVALILASLMSAFLARREFRRLGRAS